MASLLGKREPRPDRRREGPDLRCGGKDAGPRNGAGFVGGIHGWRLLGELLSSTQTSYTIFYSSSLFLLTTFTIKTCAEYLQVISIYSLPVLAYNRMGIKL